MASFSWSLACKPFTRKQISRARHKYRLIQTNCLNDNYGITHIWAPPAYCKTAVYDRPYEKKMIHALKSCYMEDEEIVENDIGIIKVRRRCVSFST